MNQFEIAKEKGLKHHKRIKEARLARGERIASDPDAVPAQPKIESKPEAKTPIGLKPIPREKDDAVIVLTVSLPDQEIVLRWRKDKVYTMTQFPSRINKGEIKRHFEEQFRYIFGRVTSV